MLAVKIIFLFVSVWLSIVNTGLIHNKERVPAINLILQAIGITGFVTIQWLL